MALRKCKQGERWYHILCYEKSGTLDHVASLALQISLLLVLSTSGSLDIWMRDSGALNLLIQVVDTK